MPNPVPVPPSWVDVEDQHKVVATFYHGTVCNSLGTVYRPRIKENKDESTGEYLLLGDSQSKASERN